MHEHHNQPEQPHDGHERETPLADRPRIWVGSLADYNNGNLHGDWLPADVPLEDLQAGVQRILDTSEEPGAEEYGIFDHDNFAGYPIGEYMPLEHVVAIASGISEHGPAFAAFASLVGGDADQFEHFEHAYLGHYETRADWAREVVDDFGLEQALSKAVPSMLAYISIDYDGWARDAIAGGDISIEDAPDGGVYVFHEP